MSTKEYFMYYMNCCKKQKLLENKVILMQKAKDIILGYTDITNIINFNQQIETLKVILLSKKEMSSFDKIYKHSFNSKIRGELFKVFSSQNPNSEFEKIKELTIKSKKIRNIIKFAL